MKRGQAKVQEFMLYGEKRSPGAELHLHIEDIPARARRYHYEIAPHRHVNLCQVLFIARGPAVVHLDDTDERVTGPALAIVPPGTVHAFRFDEQTRGFVLTLPAEADPEAAPAEMRGLLQVVFEQVFVGGLEDGALAERLAGLFERLHAEFRQPESGLAPISGWLANSILWILARHFAHERDAAQAPMRQRAWLRFRALCEAHYHEQWKVSRYARQLGLTPGRLNRLCREQCGQTASRLLQQRLTLEARRRLIYMDIPIARLARELGFRDAAYFCRFFRRNAGESPRAFRRNAASRRIGLSSRQA